MSSLVTRVSNELAGGSSRRGFLAKLGKAALLGGAVLTGLSLNQAYAACGDCQGTYGAQCCGTGQYACPGTQVYLGCCNAGGGQCYETWACYYVNGAFDCYDVFETSCTCPHSPQP